MEELQNIYLYNDIIPPYLRKKPISELINKTINYKNCISVINWLDNYNKLDSEAYCIITIQNKNNHINWYMLFSDGSYFFSTQDYHYSIINKFLLLFKQLQKEGTILVTDFYYDIKKEFNFK